MPGNPLTDPHWATDVADQVERIVGTVRDRATKPLVHIARGVVFGLIAAFLGLTALVLLLVGLTRGLQTVLELIVSWPRAVYISYLVVGGILSLAGLLVMRKRQAPRP